MNKLKQLISKIMNNTLSGLIRHGLTFVGGLMVSKGYIDEAILQEVIGAIMTLGGFVWSYLDKQRKEEV